MSETSEHVAHPVLGTLAWLPKHSHWFTQLPLASGGQLAVIIHPGEGDRRAFLPRAAELFQWAVDNQHKVLNEAVHSRLLELYNTDWRKEGHSLLSAAEFVAYLRWDFVAIHNCSIAPLELGYGANDLLFAGHDVVIKLRPDLTIHKVDLIG